MCEPTTIISIAVGVAGAAMAAKSASDQAKAQEEYENAEREKARKLAEAEKKAALEAQQAAENAAINDQILAKAKAGEEAKKFALEDLERSRQANRELAHVINSRGDIGGNSPFRDIVNARVQEEYDKSIIEENRVNTMAQIEAEKHKVFTDHMSRWNQASSAYSLADTKYSSPVKSKNTGLKIASSAVSGFSSGYSLGGSVGGMFKSGAPKTKIKDSDDIG